MIARFIAIALLAIVAVDAFPARFFLTEQWTAVDCAGTASISIVTPVDTCITSATISTKTTVTAAGALSVTNYANAACTGTGTSAGNVTAAGVCVNFLGTSIKYTLDVARTSLYSITTFSDSGCATVTNGPTCGVSGSCGAASTTKITVSGSSISLCTYTAVACAGTAASCATFTANQCLGAGTTYVKYESVGGAAALMSSPVTVAILALVAVIITKFTT